MRLLCLLNGGPEHPSSRFRVLQHLDALVAAGFEVDLLIAKRREGYDLRTLRRRARQADLILVQKKIFAPWKLRLLPAGKPMVFDFDDALFAPTPDEEDRYGARGAERRALGRARRLASTLKRARTVIAGNRFLAEHASRVAREVVVLPTGLDLSPFPEHAVRQAAAHRAARSSGRRIGWIGSRSSLRYLPALAGPLRAACARFPGTQFVQICNDFIDLPGVPTEKRPWSLSREAADLFDFDVGLMPIDDRPFARGKCGLKVLQYQVAGVPVVCSPVGANLEIVRDGENGLFAAGASDWDGAIARVLGDPALARRLGEAGRVSAAATYDASIIGERLARHLLVAAGKTRDDAATTKTRDHAPSGAAASPGEKTEGDGEAGEHQRLLVADHPRE